MKKLFAMLLALVMLISVVNVTVFADEIVAEPEREPITYSNGKTVAVDPLYGEKQTEIGADFWTEGCDPNADTKWEDSFTVVSVQVLWSETVFSYDFGDTWDPEIHAYVNHPGWNKDYIDVRVINDSNCPVQASIVDAHGVYDGTDIYCEGASSAALSSAIDPYKVEKDENKANFRIKFSYFPETYEFEPTELIYFSVKISAYVPPVVTPTDPEDETGSDNPNGEHEHHWVYDQFGRLVCSAEGCGAVKHEYCIDMDEDGICDECGLERDFCPDCHVGGTCKCT